MNTNELTTIDRGPNPMAILEKAISSGATIEMLERLVALAERWRASEAKRAFTAALSSLRSELPHIAKGRTVDFTTAKGRTNYRYEDLADLTEQLSPAMSKHGLSFRWRTDATTPGYIAVTCIVAHADGHEEETTLSGPYDNSGNKNPIQAIGSVTTYLQRYTLKAAIGVAAGVDDDGRGMPPNEPPETPQADTSPPPAGTGSAKKCPACNSDVWDNRNSPKRTDKSPLWKCKNKDCTGYKGGPWTSWLEDPWTDQNQPPADPVSEAPQYGEHAKMLNAAMHKIGVESDNACRWLSAMMHQPINGLSEVFSNEVTCETLVAAMKAMVDEGWTYERLRDPAELEAAAHDQQAADTFSPNSETERPH